MRNLSQSVSSERMGKRVLCWLKVILAPLPILGPFAGFALRLACLFFIAAIHFSLYPYSDWGPLVENASWWRDNSFLALLVTGAVGVIAAVVHLIFVAFGHRDRVLQHLVNAVAWLLPLSLYFLTLTTLRSASDLTVLHTTSRAMPVIQAIRVFEREKGEPPRSLAELVPRYIERLPKAPSRGNPEFEYVSYPSKNRPTARPRWELRMLYPGEYGPAYMIYWPDGSYRANDPAVEWIPVVDGWVIEVQG